MTSPLMGMNSPIHHFGEAVSAWGTKGVVIASLGIFFAYIIPLIVVLPWAISGIVRARRALAVSGLTPVQTADLNSAKRFYALSIVAAVLTIVIGIVLGAVTTYVGNRSTSAPIQAGGSPNIFGTSKVITLAYTVPSSITGIVSMVLVSVAEGKLRKGRK